MIPVSHSQISRRVTSVGQQARAGDVTRFGTGEIRNETGDLVGLAIALQGSEWNRVAGEVAVRWVHVGINRPRLDVVNGDAARAEVACKSLRETGDRSLCERIDRATDEGHALAVGAADVNDAAAFTHMPRSFLCRDEQATHIDGNQLLEVFQRELLNRRDDSDARVVHENVNAPKGSNGFRNGQ